jgi:hypothetical protein
MVEGAGTDLFEGRVMNFMAGVRMSGVSEMQAMANALLADDIFPLGVSL